MKKSRDKVFRKISKTQYLKLILSRHENEYMQILDLIINYNHTHERGMGFWSLIRMIFPVIESVASTIGKQKEDFLTEDLHVPFGHLVWELYRHALMHTDELRYAVYKEKTISWATHLSTDDIGHLTAKHTDSHPTTIHIDIPRLYYDLQEFLKKEIEKNDMSEINIQVGVHFPEHESLVLKELENLYTNY